MRCRTLFSLLLGVLLMSSAAWADFYVIAGGRGVGTRITSVPKTISSPGFYYLGGNLTYSGSGNAITVDADDVTLDLMGFRLINGGAMGSSTCGIYMSGRTNVEIRNGTVCGFKYGVREQSNSGKQHRVLNVRATGNDIGFELKGLNHLVKDCSATNSGGVGIFMDSGVITDCVASNNNLGIRLQHWGIVLGNTAINEPVAKYIAKFV